MKRPSLSFDYKKMTKSTMIFASKHRFTLTLISIALVFGFAVYQVDTVSDPESNQDKVAEQLKTFGQVNFNEEAIEAIKELKDNQVDIDPEFIDDRDNPFSE